MFNVTPITCPIWVSVPKAVASIVSYLSLENVGTILAVSRAIASKLPTASFEIFKIVAFVCGNSFSFHTKSTSFIYRAQSANSPLNERADGSDSNCTQRLVPWSPQIEQPQMA